MPVFSVMPSSRLQAHAGGRARITVYLASSEDVGMLDVAATVDGAVTATSVAPIWPTGAAAAAAFLAVSFDADAGVPLDCVALR